VKWNSCEKQHVVPNGIEKEMRTSYRN